VWLEIPAWGWIVPTSTSRSLIRVSNPAFGRDVSAESNLNESDLFGSRSTGLEEFDLFGSSDEG